MCNGANCKLYDCPCKRPAKPKPHKHAEIIKAWADGARIEVRGSFNYKDTWSECTNNPYWAEHQVYRIKPEPKPDILLYGYAYVSAGKRFGTVRAMGDVLWTEANVKLVFDGETNKLKSVEMIK